jgi:hypothetical protein
MTALIAATILLASGCGIFHYGTNFRGGAGAPGSILMLIGAATVVVSVFVFGIATGLLIA